MSEMIPRDASVKITIDPSAAKREADALRRDLARLNEAKKKAHEEIEHYIDGIGRVVDNKRPGPNAPDGGRSVPVANNASGANALGTAVDTMAMRYGLKGFGNMAGNAGLSGGLASGIMGFARTAAIPAAIIGGLYMGTRMAPKITAGLSELATGLADKLPTQLQGPVQELAKWLDEKSQAMDAKIKEFESMVSGAMDTITDVIDYNSAALKLGGRWPKDQTSIIKEYYTINQKQAQLDKTLNQELDREMVRNLTKATMALFSR